MCNPKFVKQEIYRGWAQVGQDRELSHTGRFHRTLSKFRSVCTSKSEPAFRSPRVTTIRTTTAGSGRCVFLFTVRIAQGYFGNKVAWSLNLVMQCALHET
jgi:hypothetical protein